MATVDTRRAGGERASNALGRYGLRGPFREVGYKGPSLLLGFSDNVYRMGAPNVAPQTLGFADLVTFTRASGGGRFNAQGQYEWVATNAPRLDYDPVTLQARGLLIEEQRVNLLTYSEQFDNAAWTKTAVSVVANAAVAPDGTLTADKISATALTLIHEIWQPFTSVAGTVYSGSYFVKAGEHSFVQLLGPSAVFAEFANFDLVTGTRTAGTAGFGQIQPAGNGWFRISLSATALSASTSARISLALVASGASARGAAYTGDGTSGIYIWGAQLEPGAFPTSYIPTVASQVTRAADVALVNTLSPWYNASEGTIVVKASTFAASGLTRWATIQNVNATERWGLLRTATATAEALVSAGGVLQGSTSTGSIPVATTVTMASAISAGGLIVALNGSSGASVPISTIPSPDRLIIGNQGGANQYLNGHLRSIQYLPRRLTNAELQAITA